MDDDGIKAIARGVQHALRGDGFRFCVVAYDGIRRKRR